MTDLSQRLMVAAAKATRASNLLPSGASGDYQFAVQTDLNFKKELQLARTEALLLLHSVASHVDLDGEATDNIQQLLGGANSIAPRGAGLFDSVVSLVDMLLERADLALDAASGVGSSSVSVVAGSKRVAAAQQDDSTANKPQLQWQHDVDNARDRPFVPKLKVKLHARAPLNLSPLPCPVSEEASFAHFIPHPYHAELQALRDGYLPQQLSVKDRPLYAAAPLPPVEAGGSAAPGGVLFRLVDTEEALRKAMEEILAALPPASASASASASPQPAQGQLARSASSSLAAPTGREISLDVEHHSFRSFLGLTCLVQLSTRSGNYIFEALALRLHLHALNQVTADPTVVKVMHGCRHDIGWLQRDLGVYVVNLFDTHEAGRKLGLPAVSLAALLKRYIGADLDKRFQLADWRQRPLPADMLRYAQLDTHHLLMLADFMHAELTAGCDFGDECAELREVLEAGRLLCLKRYEKPFFDPLGWRALFLPSPAAMGGGAAGAADGPDSLGPHQAAVAAALWEWRDRVAREEDESLNFVLGNQDLVSLAKACPTSVGALLAQGQAKGGGGARGRGMASSAAVQRRAKEIVAVIQSVASVAPTAVQIRVPVHRSVSASAASLARTGDGAFISPDGSLNFVPRLGPPRVGGSGAVAAAAAGGMAAPVAVVVRASCVFGAQTQAPAAPASATAAAASKKRKAETQPQAAGLPAEERAKRLKAASEEVQRLASRGVRSVAGAGFEAPAATAPARTVQPEQMAVDGEAATGSSDLPPDEQDSDVEGQGSALPPTKAEAAVAAAVAASAAAAATLESGAAVAAASAARTAMQPAIDGASKLFSAGSQVGMLSAAAKAGGGGGGVGGGTSRPPIYNPYLAKQQGKGKDKDKGKDTQPDKDKGGKDKAKAKPKEVIEARGGARSKTFT